MKSLSDLWESILSRLSGELSDTTIKTWFDEISVVTMEDSALVLHCSNAFKKNTVEARFLPQIKAALKDIFSSDLEVKILNDEQLAAAGVPAELVRMSCGLESAEDLIADIAQALDKV